MMHDMLKTALVLTLITTIAATALSYTNYITEPLIEEQRIAEMNKALSKVMPGADEFREMEHYWSAYSNGELIGMITIAKGPGYSSNIETMVGINKENQITGIQIISQQETPGLGARIAEPEFTDRFRGKTSAQIDEVDGITGATISSTAVKESIKEQLAKVDAITGAVK